MANGATVIRPDSSFADALQTAATNATRFMLERQRIRQEQERIDLATQAQEFGQAYNMLVLGSEFIKQKPGSTLRSLGPGFVPYIERLVGPEGAPAFLDAGISPETVKSVADDYVLGLLDSKDPRDRELGKQIIEHSAIKDATGVPGGAAGLGLEARKIELSDTLVKAQQGVWGDIYNQALDPAHPDSVESSQLLYQMSRVAAGLPVEFEFQGQKFQSSEHFNAFINGLRYENELLMGDPSKAREFLQKEAEASFNLFKDRIEIPLGTWLMLHEAARTPDEQGRRKLDVMFQNGDVPPAVYKYLTDHTQTARGAFLLPLQASNDPRAQALLGTIGGAEVISEPFGKEGLPLASRDIGRQYQQIFPGLPSGYITTHSRLTGLLPGVGSDDPSGIRFNVPEAGTPGAPPGIEVPWVRLTPEQQVQRVVDSMQAGLQVPDPETGKPRPVRAKDLVDRGIPTEIVAAAMAQIATRGAAGVPGARIGAGGGRLAGGRIEGGFSPPEELRKKYGLSGNPAKIVASARTEAQQSGFLDRAFGEAEAAAPEARTMPIEKAIKSLDSVPPIEQITPEQARSVLQILKTGSAPNRLSKLGVTDPDQARLIQLESGGRPTAKNPNSSAFGIGQLIDTNRAEFGERLGIDPNTKNPKEQLRMMDAYTNERYRQHAERLGITVWEAAMLHKAATRSSANPTGWY